MPRFKEIYLFTAVIFLLVATFQAVAQENRVPDTTHLMNLVRSADSLVGVDNNKAVNLLKEAQSVVDQLPFEEEDAEKTFVRCAADFYSVKGYVYYDRNMLNEAVHSFRKAEKLYDRVDAKNSQAECLNNSAVILNTMGNNVEAIKSYHAAISIYESLNDSLGKGYAYNNVSRIYRQQGSHEQAMKYVLEALEISMAMGDKSLESLALNSKAGLEKVSGDTNQALKTYQRALSIRKEVQDSIGIASVLNNIGSIFKGSEEYQKALDYFEQSRNIARAVDYQAGIGHTSNNIGEVYFELGLYALAQENGLTALKISEEFGLLSLNRQSAELLMQVYKAKGDWKKAFEMQRLVIKAKDQIVNQETKQIAQREAMRYEFEKERALDKKEEEQFMRLQKEKDERDQIFYIAIGLVVILLLFLLFFVIHRLRSAREQNKLILKQSNERKLLLQEVHHRVKNNFQIVSSLLRLQSYSIDDDSLRSSFEEAVSRINSMAIVHDIIYRQEKFSEIDAKEYLEKLIKTLQKTSGNPNIDITIKTDRPKLKIETLIHLGIALNELVINSFKYAFNEMEVHPRILVTLNGLGTNKFELIYQDNGVGLNKELSKSSFGMELIETLIEHLDGEVEIKNLEDWKTTIILRFADL